MFFKRSDKRDHEQAPEKVKVLIVDDELNFVEQLGERLEKSNFEVITASNGVEGLNKARKDKPEVILLDVAMPVMDGHEMLEALRKQPGGDYSSVIMLTGRSQIYDFARASTCGIDDYIVKPFEHKVLLQKIREVVESRKAPVR